MWKRLLILSSSMILAVSTAHAAGKPAEQATSAAQDQSFYSVDRLKGWYGYEKLPEEKKKKCVTCVKKKKELSLEDYTYSQLWNMHPKEFRELSKQFLERAVQNPTEDNVYEYLVLQDIARRKAAAFTGTFTLVTQQHPELTMNDVVPRAAPGRVALKKMVKEDISRTIDSARGDFALVVFTRQGCRFCAAQRSILEFFQQRHDWPMKVTDIGMDPRGANLAASMGIDRVPAIVVVCRETGKYMPVSVGVIAVDELEKRLYYAIQYMSGRRKPQQFFLYDFQKGSGADPLANLEKAKGGEN